jgi:hypothetical protein
LTGRNRGVTFPALTTPFYFLFAGAKVPLPVLSTWTWFGLVVVKGGAKVVGVWPLTRFYGMVVGRGSMPPC